VRSVNVNLVVVLLRRSISRIKTNLSRVNFYEFSTCTRKKFNSERIERRNFISNLNPDLIFLDLTSPSAPHVVHSSQYWIGQTVDKTVSPWNATWKDGTATNYGNWVVPTLGLANGNCSGVCATILYSASNQNPGTWNIVDQNSGYYPAICQINAVY
jgi:hypothetical protein